MKKQAAMDKQIIQLEEERLERMERRLKKERAKLRRLKKKRSVVGITKPAKIQEKRRMVEEEDGITKITQDQQQQTKKKTKMVRLKPEVNYAVAVLCNAPPFPRIPDWQLAMQSEYTQELYRESIALCEEIDKVHQDMNEQVFRKGYIEVEVTDDEEDDSNTEE